MKPVKIAQIGSGHDHAGVTFQSLLDQPDCYEVIGFAESNPERKEIPAVYAGVPHFTVDELLEMPELEAVAIECEEWDATAIAQRFADKGIAIHMDKPGSQDLEAFEKLIDTVKSKKIPFHVGYMYRYNPSVKHLFQMIKEGELGEIFSVEAQMNCKHPVHKRQWMDHFKGGMMFFLGCHLVDMVLQLQGDPLEIIPMNMSTGIDGVTGEDYGFAVFRYPNGISFIKTCATEENGYDRRYLAVSGSKGSYEIKPWEAEGKVSQRTSPSRYALSKDNPDFSWKNLAVELDFGSYNRYDAMMRKFSEIVRGAENPYTYDYELKLFKTVLKCCGM